MTQASIIYSLVDENGTPFYVGQTRNPERREKRHRKRFVTPFRFVTLAECQTREEANERERRTIDEYRNAGILLYNKTFNPLSNRPVDGYDMVRDFVLGALNRYDEIQEIAARHQLSMRDLLIKAVRHFDRDYISLNAAPADLLETPFGTLSHEQARAMYRRLSSYFARKGAERLPTQLRKRRGKAAAAKRWGKEQV